MVNYKSKSTRREVASKSEKISRRKNVTSFQTIRKCDVSNEDFIKKYNGVSLEIFLKAWVKNNLEDEMGGIWESKSEEERKEWVKENLDYDWDKFLGIGKERYYDFLDFIFNNLNPIPKEFESFLHGENPDDFMLVYRSIGEKSPDKVDFNKLHVWWTYSMTLAKGWNPEGSIITALVHKKDINWLSTFLRNTEMSGDYEHEITINKESEIIPVEIGRVSNKNYKKEKHFSLPEVAFINRY